IFDYCYPVDAAPVLPELGEEPGFLEIVTAFLGSAIAELVYSDETAWDHEVIQDSIREGKQYWAARVDEMNNPTVYRVGSHDCAAEIFVPDVKVIDNCSGVHSVKAMVE